MLILGFHGGTTSVYDVETPPPNTHDGAAVLLRDGEVVAALEDERANRVKHSDKCPMSAIRAVLDIGGVTLDQVDYIAIPFLAEFAQRMLKKQHLEDPTRSGPLDAVTMLRSMLQAEFGVDVPENRFQFVRHHIAHATLAYDTSGFERSLVVTLDAQGEAESGLVMSGEGNELELLRSFPIHASLGHFFMQAISFLGYQLFDEYKVMGLAPYGNPERFRSRFETFYRLLPDGGWELSFEKLTSLYEVLKPRRRGGPIEQIHKDLAASLQDMLEGIVLHLLRHCRQNLGHNTLCMGGGIAHNCTMNGKILRAGLFDDIFVQPAAHDAGNALGAAFHVHRKLAGRVRNKRLKSVYWGNDIGESDQVGRQFEPWAGLLAFRKSPDIAAEVAQRLTDGEVVGWVQGRSEFGPRALGNRSILADPRPARNKDLINQMVKKRESYQPFAPSVLEESVAEYFEVPEGRSDFPFMNFVLAVRPEKREILGAVTHVDGTARVQTVSRSENPRYWALIDAFRQRSGVPILLNTSFNNNVEPIVDSVEDAVVCFLTTGIQTLAIGDFIAVRKSVQRPELLRLVPWLPTHGRLRETCRRDPSTDEICTIHEVGRATWYGEKLITVDANVHSVLRACDGRRSLEELIGSEGIARAHIDVVVAAMLDLWSQRAVLLHPRPHTPVKCSREE
jgi:carbamoyltransferase